MYAGELDGKKHNFGVVGVDEGTLIMYDEETQSQWSQLFGKAVSGKMKGVALEKLPSTMTTWGQWKALHPKTTVYVKRSVPYNSRFTTETFEKAANMDPGPARGNDLIIGLEGHVEARAYLLRRLAQERFVEDAVEMESRFHDLLHHFRIGPYSAAVSFTKLPRLTKGTVNARVTHSTKRLR